MASFVYDVNAMVWGSADIVRPDTGVAYNGATNLLDSNEPTEVKFKLAGATDQIGIGVTLPLKQSDGTTNTTGTLTVQVRTFRNDGTTVIDTVTKNYTLGSAQQDFIRVGRTMGAMVVGVLLTMSAAGNAGIPTIGLAVGGPFLHPADLLGNG
jgi:hypothetical protein